MNIHFVLICEGTSDEGLIPHLETLCLDAGADEVYGNAPDLSRRNVGHALKDKIQAILELEPQANLLFLHRDADAWDSTNRHEEITKVTISCGLTKKWVAVVPVQETEAWLLLDEKAIRTVAGKPNGRTTLKLPRPTLVENIASPKEVLKEKLSLAAEVTGRRHQSFIAKFPSMRRLLLQRLAVGGPLLQVHSWCKMKSALEEAIQTLRSEQDIVITQQQQGSDPLQSSYG